MADNNLHQAVVLCATAPRRVVPGERRYLPTGWTRKDLIYLGNQKIGFIRLSDKDRTGETVSTVSGQSRKGRAIDWCVEQAEIVRLAGINRQLRAA